jgi:NAD+--asparagine ADP-ribosyltransferase
MVRSANDVVANIRDAVVGICVRYDELPAALARRIHRAVSRFSHHIRCGLGGLSTLIEQPQSSESCAHHP